MATEFFKINNKDAIAFYALIFLFLVWLVYVPDNNRLPYIAMPTHCAVISEHTDAGGRYTDFFNISGVKAATRAFGLDPKKLAEDSGTKTLIQLTTGETTLIGFSNAAGPDSEPTLFGASCCGWRGCLLKLMLATRWIPGLGRLSETESGVRYLLVDEDEPDGLKAAFAIHDNTLLATLSYNPEVIREIERRVELKLPISNAYQTSTPWNDRATCMHRFWIDGQNAADIATEYAKTIREYVSFQIPEFKFAKLDIKELTNDKFNLSATLETYNPIFEQDTILFPLSGHSPATEILPLEQSAALLVLSEEAGASLAQKYIPETVIKRTTSREDSVLTINDGEIGPDFKIRGIQIPAATAYISGVEIPETAFDKYGSPRGLKENAHNTPGAKLFPTSSTVDIIYKNLKKIITPLSFLLGIDKELLKKELVTVSKSQGNGVLLCSSYPSLNKQFSFKGTENGVNWKKWLEDNNQKRNAVAYLRINTYQFFSIAGRATTVMQLINNFVHIDGISGDTLSTISQITSDANFSDTLNILLLKEADNRVSVEIGNQNTSGANSPL